MTETEPEVLRYLREIERKQDVILERLEMSRPVLDGIPLLAKSIDILQRDVRMTAAMSMRANSTLTNLVAEFSARKLEDAP